MSNKDSLTKLEPEHEGLPSLFAKMVDDVTQLFDTKVALLRVELKEEVSNYARGGIMILIGGVIGVVGFALLNVALAFLVSMLFQTADVSQPVRYGLGFIITGLIYLVGGGVIIIVTKNRLAKLGIVPRRTVAELERDKEWLQEGLK